MGRQVSQGIFPIVNQVTAGAGIGEKRPIKVVTQDGGDRDQRQFVQRNAELCRRNKRNGDQQNDGQDDPIAKTLVTDFVQ